MDSDSRFMVDETRGMVKVRFELQADRSGWPPFSSEGVWAAPLSGDRYRLDNVPFFAPLVSCDDVVSALPRRDGQLWVEGVAGYGGHSTIRVIVVDSAGIEQLRADLKSLGCGSEVFLDYRLVAVDIPAESSLTAVQSLFAEGELAGRWHYEESCLSAHHTQS